MQFRNDAAQTYWTKQLEHKKNDDHTRGLLRYAERLANILETSDRSPEAFLAATFAADNPTPKQVTILMYSFAVALLVKVWLYGDDLKTWHNQHWKATGIPFKVEKEWGVIMPCAIQAPDGKYATLIGVYVELARMDQPQLKRLVQPHSL